MKIILVQTEIEEALRQYIASRITTECDIEINLVASRGPQGITAELDLIEKSAPRPAAKPVPVTAPVEAPKLAAVAVEAKPAPEEEDDIPESVLAQPGEALLPEETPPFVTDAEEEAAPVKTSGKSLFASG